MLTKSIENPDKLSMLQYKQEKDLVYLRSDLYCLVIL